MKKQRTKNSQQEQRWRSYTLDIKIYHQATVNGARVAFVQVGKLNQWNKIDNLEEFNHRQSRSRSMTKVWKESSGKKTFSINDAGSVGYPYGEKLIILTPTIGKINPSYIRDLNVRGETNIYIPIYSILDPHTGLTESYALLQFIFYTANQVILNHKLDCIRLSSML